MGCVLMPLQMKSQYPFCPPTLSISCPILKFDDTSKFDETDLDFISTNDEY